MLGSASRCNKIVAAVLTVLIILSLAKLAMTFWIPC